MPPINNSIKSTSHLQSSRQRFDSQPIMKQRRQFHNDDATLARITTQMLASRKYVFTFLLLGLFVSFASAVEEKTVKPSGVSSTNLGAHRDEIYIDDEGIEGSGGRGGSHDDLDKDSDYSGSGFGPDDEDSSTDQHHRRTNIHTQSGNSKHNINDNDIISSRTHQTNSGTIIGSGTSGNSGIIGSSGSGNTGLNTIGKNHSSTAPSTSFTSSSTPTTTKTTANDHKNQHTTTSSSLYPIQTHLNPSSPHTPPVHTDNDDDFDLDEDIGGGGGIGGAGGLPGSGDGGVIDNDDDDTGDIDDDDDLNTDIIRTHHHNSGATVRGEEQKPPVDGIDTTKIDDDYKHHQSSNEDRKHILWGSNTDNAGENGGGDHDDDDDDTPGNYDDNVDDDNDDGTEMYTDVTDPSSENSDTNGNKGATHNQPGVNTQGGTIHELDTINSISPDTKVIEHTTGNEVLIMNASDDDRTTSFFAQPGILAAVIGGAVVGLLCAILVVMFIVYRMRKKDEGSYALDEPKRSPAVNSYAKNANNREFYA